MKYVVRVLREYTYSEHEVTTHELKQCSGLSPESGSIIEAWRDQGNQGEEEESMQLDPVEGWERPV